MEGDNYVNYDDDVLIDGDGHAHISYLYPCWNSTYLASPGILVKRIFDIHFSVSLLFLCDNAMTPVRAISCTPNGLKKLRAVSVSSLLPTI
jgi:hypothetical protein